MKKITTFLFLLSAVFCDAQIDTSSIYPNLKRVIFPKYFVHTEERGETFYYYGDQKINKNEYLEFKKNQDILSVPHIRQIYHKDSWLEFEAVMLGDCCLVKRKK